MWSTEGSGCQESRLLLDAINSNRESEINEILEEIQLPISEVVLIPFDEILSANGAAPTPEWRVIATYRKF